MQLLIFGFGTGEIVFIVLVVLVFFGADKIPGLARTVGKGMNEFRRATDDIKREFEDSTKEIRKDVRDLKDKMTKDDDLKID